jgi:hypothetical protein
MAILEQALAYNRAGYNVIPLIPNDKIPVGAWRFWQTRAQSAAWVERTFAAHDGNIGTLGGVTSTPGGRLYPFYLDFDDRGAYGELAPECPPTRRVETRRGGHVWLFAHAPVRSKAYKRHGFEVRGVGQYVMGPPSIHPSGLRYEFTDELATVAVADTLPFVDLEFDSIPETYTPNLPRLAQRILHSDEKTLSAYPTRSEIDAALVMALVNSGRDLAAIKGLMDAASYPSHYRSLPESRRFGWLFGVVEKCKALGNRPEWEQAQSELATFRAFVVTLPAKLVTTARTGVVDKKTLLAHISTAQAAGRFEYQLSARDGAELAQVKPDTFAVASNRLAFHGWIAKREQAVATCAQRFELARDRIGTLPYTDGIVWECPDVVSSPRSQDDMGGVFEFGRRDKQTGLRRGGLGRGPAETWAALGRLGPCALDELQEATGFCRATVRRHVMRLESVGLVDFDGATVNRTALDVQDAGAILGTLGIADKRRSRHIAQRAAYRGRFDSGARVYRRKDGK